MSEDENLAVVRRTIESFANDVETWLDTLDPAVEWHPDEEHRTLEELRGNGEHVFSDLREWGRGRGSGIVIEDHDYAHWKVRNGKIVYCCEYGTRNEALEAAGLSE